MRNAMRRLERLEAAQIHRGGVGFVFIEDAETEEEAFGRAGIERGECSIVYIMDLGLTKRR